MDLFTLAAKLTLDSSSFDSGLKSAESAGSGLASKLNKITSVAKKVAGALVFKKGVQALKSLADAAAQAGDRIDKNSQKLGLSRTAYQEWDYILSQCGASIDSMGTAMKTLNNKLESGTDAVDALGLSMEDLSGLNMEQRFEAIVKAFQSMPEGAEKSRLAVELFGKQGQELLPLLNSSADSIEELKQKFHDLGLEMSDSQIDAAVKYSDAMDTLQRVFDAIKYTIGAELLPVMTDWAEKAASYAGKLLKAYKEDGGLDGVFKVLNTDITTLTTNLKESGNPVLEALGAIIEGIWTGLETAVGLFTDFPGTVQKLKESDSVGLQILGAAIEAVGDALQWIIDNQGAVEIAVAAIVGAFAAAKIVEFISALNPLTVILAAIAAAALAIATNWESIKATVIQIWENIKTAAETAWQGIKKAVENAVKGARDTLTNVWSNIKSTAEAAWNLIKTTASTVWEAIKTAVENAVKGARDTLTNVWTSVVTTAEAAWNLIKTTAQSIWNGIKGFIENPIKTARDTLTNIWSNIKSTAVAAWNSFKAAVEPIVNSVKSVIDGVVSAVQSVIDWFKKLMGYDGKELSNTTSTHTHTNVIKTVEDVAGAAREGLGGAPEPRKTVQELAHALGFARGDWNVPYDMPAMLHRNEMVLTASQARRYRDGDGSGMDMAALANTIVSAVREGMAGASVNSFLDGQNVTDEISRIVGEAMTARRFA